MVDLNNSIKLVIVGDEACGKTCMLTTFAEAHFPDSYVPTGMTASDIDENNYDVFRNCC